MMNRRAFLSLILFIASTVVFGQTSYPSRPIRILVPFPAGGGTDSLARLIGSKLSENLKWTVVIENKPGAGGNLALDTTAKSAPDGYTFVMAQTDNVVLNPLLYAKLTYDPVKDLVPVALISSGAAVLVVKEDSPYKTLADLIAAAKANPGNLTFASPGNGTVAHVILQLWQKNAGIQLTHVPYRGVAQSMPDLLGGSVDMYMGSVPTLLGFIKSGKVRALGVTAAQRSSALPSVPTFDEAGVPGVVLVHDWGLMAPVGTPADVINQVNSEVNKLLNSSDVREKILATGADLFGGSAKQMADKYAADRARLAPIIREAGIKLD